MTVQSIDFGRKVHRWQTKAFAVRWDSRSATLSAILALVTVVLVVVGLGVGDYALTPVEVVRAILIGEDSFARKVVLEWRLPRALAAPLFGAALALSGLVFQRLTRNPLASPDVIGFSTGAYTGALFVLTVLGGTFTGVTFGALFGGLIAAAIVLLLTGRGGMYSTRLVIVGIATSAAFAALNSWMLKVSERADALAASVWGAGSLHSVNGQQLAVAAGALLAVGAVLLGLLPRLAQLELGDDVAKSQGVPVSRSRALLVVPAVSLMAVVTAATGPISFVALVSPQLATRLTRSPTTILPSLLTGAALLTVADVATQTLLPSDLPVGLVTLVIGGGYLVWLLLRPTERGSA